MISVPHAKQGDLVFMHCQGAVTVPDGWTRLRERPLQRLKRVLLRRRKVTTCYKVVGQP